ncbi:translocation/assembly module TamB domain-containing protein [Ancylobacter lacus]|nr:translocation/assembly module TamB domain-containing protein [Ancylobacter lacus]
MIAGFLLRLLAVAGLLLLTVVVVAALAFGLAQTPPGKRLLAQVASHFASQDGLAVTITDIGGFVPSDLTIGRIELADAGGRFATVENAALVWRPLALLGARLDIDRLEATRVTVERRPVLAPAAAATPAQPGGGFALPVRLGRIAIGSIELAEPVAGHAARLALEGSADLTSLQQGLSARFALERQDAPGSAHGALSYRPEGRILDVNVTAQEPAGGLVARAARIEGLPALTARVVGAGPIDAWNGDIDLKAGDVAAVTGKAGIRAIPAGYRVRLDLDSDVGRLLPPTLAPLVQPRATLAGTADIDEALRVRIESLAARSAALDARLSGSLDLEALTADLTVSLAAGDAAAFAGLLPPLDPALRWSTLRASGTVKGALANPEVVATLEAADLAAAGYGAGTLTLAARTVPATDGSLPFTLEGRAGGLTAADPKVAAALGTEGSFTVSGVRPALGPIALDALTVHLTALTAQFDGRADSTAIAGAAKVARLDLAALSPLAGRTLAGTLAFDATLDASSDFSRAAVQLTGTTNGLRTGIPQVDGLLGQRATIAGGLARDGEKTIRFKDFRVTAEGFDTTVNGRLAPDRADLAARLSLADLARLDPRVSGALEGEAAFSGTLENLGLKARLAIPAGTAMGQKIQGLSLSFDGTDITRLPAGGFRLDGRVADRPATGSGSLTSEADGARRLQGLAIAIGSATAKGDVTIGTDAIATGELAISAGDLADLSPFALTQLGGRLDGRLTLSRDGGRQRAALNANAANVLAAGTRIGGARLDLSVLDPAGATIVGGTADLTAIATAGLDISRARLTAQPDGSGSRFTLDGVVNDVNLTGAGRVERRGTDVALRLDRLSLARGSATLTSTAPANFLWSNSTLSIDRLVLAGGGGRTTLAGRVGEQIDLTVDATGLPLALADLARPGLNLSGTLGGNARITGTAAVPTGTYTLNIAQFTAAQLASAGTGPLQLRAEGRLAGGRIDTRATIAGRNLQGVTVTGSAPISQGQLDVAVRGTLDLAGLNPLLAASAQQVSGRAVADLTVRGTPAEPRAGGTIRITGATFNDAVTGISLSRIEGVLTGTDRSVTVTSFTAATRNGGSISARGTVALDPAGGFPGRIDVDLRNAGLVSTDLLRLVAEGRVALEGPLAQAPRVTGRLVVKTLDINIAERLPGGVGTLDVKHVNVPPGSKARAGARQARKPPPAAGGGIPLDLTVSAPNSVFVRGMGLDAELGGDIKLSGTSRAPVALGGFQLRRGWFNILGQRLTFTRGRITFTGSPDPELDFVAETTANDVTAQVLVSGPASQPQVTFSSTPSMAQDEVLARLMFGRSAGSLTGGQALQVAQTIAQFSGRGSGALDQMRRALGVDSLDVGTNAAGNGGVLGLGRRLNDNIYLGVRQGTTPGSGQVTVDVDVTKRIRLQGATGSDGSTSVGVGAQWDY